MGYEQNMHHHLKTNNNILVGYHVILLQASLVLIADIYKIGFLLSLVWGVQVGWIGMLFSSFLPLLFSIWQCESILYDEELFFFSSASANLLKKTKIPFQNF